MTASPIRPHREASHALDHALDDHLGAPPGMPAIDPTIRRHRAGKGIYGGRGDLAIITGIANELRAGVREPTRRSARRIASTPYLD